MSKQIMRTTSKAKRRYSKAQIERNRLIALVIIITIVSTVMLYQGIQHTKENPDAWQQEIQSY